MLGYFGIYSNDGSRWFRQSDTSRNQHRSIFGILPHEIAALNARAADRKADTSVMAGLPRRPLQRLLERLDLQSMRRQDQPRAAMRR